MIGETLRRATPPYDRDNIAFRARLTRRIADPGQVSQTKYAEFVADPLSSGSRRPSDCERGG